MLEILEFPRPWEATLLVHGLPLAEDETFLEQGRAVARLLGRQLGIRQEMAVVGLTRLQPTRAELGGHPPLAVTFRSLEQAAAVLRRAGTCRGAEPQVTESMTRVTRRQWGALHLFLGRVRGRYPGVAGLVRAGTLHLDGRRFLWSGQAVQEQNDFIVPSTVNDTEKEIRSQIRMRSKLNVEDLKTGYTA
jgi:hypothetical protein